MALLFYKNRLPWKGKTVTEAFTTLPLRIFLASHAASAVSAKISVGWGLQGNERELYVLWEVPSFLHTAFSHVLKPLSILCIFPRWREMLLMPPQLHSQTLFLCPAFKTAKQTCLQVPDSIHTLWLETPCHFCLLQTLKPVYLLHIKLPVLLAILFFSLFLRWDAHLLTTCPDPCVHLPENFRCSYSPVKPPSPLTPTQKDDAISHRCSRAALIPLLTPSHSWRDTWVGHLWYTSYWRGWDV